MRAMRIAGSVSAAVALLLAGPAALAAPAADAPAADPPQLLFVHGYGNGKNCNGDTWNNALKYYQDDGGRDRTSMTTIGYYSKDQSCDATIGDGKASTDRPIQDIARDLANYIDDEYSSKGEPVNIVAHSMGGLVTRVALLGSAQGWDGFPGKLDVDNVVTLSTPHQGIAESVRNSATSRQWNQMTPGSGFLARLHENGSGLGDDWASGTDWSLVGSDEDDTVNYDSGIDKGNHADQKYRYKADDSGGADGYDVDHQAVRERTKGAFYLQYWHASGDHGPHVTTDGWAPLKAAFKAATHVGDDLPK